MPKITLKHDWDFTSTIAPNEVMPSPHFQGRQRITSILANEIVRRTRGSILIGGERGVGKSEIVHKALALARGNCGNKILLIVPVNASQFEDTEVPNVQSEQPVIGSTQSSVTPRRIIAAIIRGLYRAVTANTAIDAGQSRSLLDLYEKAVAQEWSHTKHADMEKSLAAALRETREITAQLNAKWIPALLAAVTSSVTTLGLSKSGLELWAATAISTVASAGAFVGAPLLWQRRTQRDSTWSNKQVTKRELTFDNSISNLEYDLDVQQKSFVANHRIVYVIDEMDKLAPADALKSLKYFKLLITSSEAIFIFITETETFDAASRTNDVENKHRPRNRPPEYTLFTSKFYIERPRTTEALAFLDSIIEASHSDEKMYRSHFQRSLLFASEHDFFDLKTQIQNRITEFDTENRPVLASPVKIDDVRRARYQKAVAIMLEGKYLGQHPLTWRENEKLWKAAFTHAKLVCSLREGESLDEKSLEEGLTGDIRKDLNALFYKLGALIPVQDIRVQRGNSVTLIKDWRATASIEDPPNRLEDPTRYELEYLNYFNELVDFAVSLHNATASFRGERTVDAGFLKTSGKEIRQKLSAFGFDFDEVIDQHWPRVHWIISNDVKRMDRDSTTETQKQIEQSLHTFKRSLPRILANLITAIFSLSQTNLYQDPTVFTGAAQPIRQAFRDSAPAVVSSLDGSRQALFIHEQIQPLQGLATDLYHCSDTHKVVVVSEFEGHLAPEAAIVVNAGNSKGLQHDVESLITTLKHFFQVESTAVLGAASADSNRKDAE